MIETTYTTPYNYDPHLEVQHLLGSLEDERLVYSTEDIDIALDVACEQIIEFIETKKLPIYTILSGQFKYTIVFLASYHIVLSHVFDDLENIKGEEEYLDSLVAVESLATDLLEMTLNDSIVAPKNPHSGSLFEVVYNDTSDEYDDTSDAYAYQAYVKNTMKTDEEHYETRYDNDYTVEEE